MEEEEGRVVDEEDRYPPNPKVRRCLLSGFGGGLSSPARANVYKIKNIKIKVQNKGHITVGTQ